MLPPVQGHQALAALLVAISSVGAPRAADAEPSRDAGAPAPGEVEPAPDEGAPAPGEVEPAPDERFGHAMQAGVRAAVMGGYRMVLRYDDSPFCSEPDFAKSIQDQQKFCGHLGPVMLDLAASFAPLASIEPFVMLRLGLSGESQTDTRPLRILAVGTRIYTRPNKPVKFFVEPSVGVEFEAGAGDPAFAYHGAFDPQYDTDVIFRAALGPQIDLAQHFGLYVQVFGMSVGVLRYLHATMEFGAGLQARFP